MHVSRGKRLLNLEPQWFISCFRREFLNLNLSGEVNRCFSHSLKYLFSKQTCLLKISQVYLRPIFKNGVKLYLFALHVFTYKYRHSTTCQNHLIFIKIHKVLNIKYYTCRYFISHQKCNLRINLQASKYLYIVFADCNTQTSDFSALPQCNINQTSAQAPGDV